MSLAVPILFGSVRSDRRGIRVARFLGRQLAERGHRPTLVDAPELRLLLLDRMYTERPKGAAPEPLEGLATLYRGADAFVIVSGEYNHGIPPALENLLDHFLEEYFCRPSAVACYSAGAFRGVRAAMQPRMTPAELGMPSIPSLFEVPKVQDALAEDGTGADETTTRGCARFLTKLEWYARALQRQRAEGTPY